LVELSKGQVHVKSNVGVGTTFTVTIPLNKCNSQDKNILGNPDTVDLSNAGKILLVEDNLLNQKYSGYLLDKWGLTWDLAENGAVAVEKCNETNYSMILMDIQMPEMNGHEATTQIRSSSNSNANVPIIALSAFAFEHEVSKSINSGMNDHLTKPFVPMDLKKKIAEHLRALPVEASVDDPFTHHEMLDASYLESFYEGDFQCMLEMFEVFIKHVSWYTANFGTAIESGNWDEVSALAHKLKPIFAMVGLHHKQAIMIRLEKEGGSDSPDLEQIKEGYQEFEDLFEELLPVLEEEVIRIKNFLK
jgi:CheY-like chemotaxis protein/HPt (histidine-containing phosphotransfer) domain-containing protein